ncbi:phosphoadenylyl-sulfate reductase [Segetibacter sp. 3557_3]|uniref:phosphoadenylyl-sulfate reductase n=1 Tax=Segetibacter sp. 3557_3 TaxID=2547429 RepID=UPI00105913B3|nr:phosphoadenylyl-sulfate reductase [Segetibacter sp. 3557_3]TDH25662.1 phosphoadenylyl-sulfate reductase [Segetibacter sp. 3557_3]
MLLTHPDYLTEIQQRVASLSIEEVLFDLSSRYPGRVTFSTSFSFEDQAITHIILSNKLPISIFTLDTGRLFPETYSVWSATNERYNTRVKPYYPDHDLIETFVGTNGPNSFYESVENRKSCCYIRKVEPLKRALNEQAVWITGLRAEHSTSRHEMPQVEWDEGNNVLKYHPILHWSTEEVKEYIRKHNIPYNPLHDKGFVSIGCAPCTRAVRPGEDFRAGRWWWEDTEKKECGLHVHVVD